MSSLFDFVRKDLRLQLRDLKELALLLLMPILLIAILGLALGQFIAGGPVQLDIHAGVVVEDDPVAGRAAFQARLAQAELPLPQRVALAAASLGLEPVEMVRSVVLSPELAELVTVEELPREEALDRLADDELQAVITLPAGFTEELLAGMLLNEGGATLEVLRSDASQLRAGIVEGVMDGFAREVSFQSALSQALQSPPPSPPAASGGIEEVAVGRRVSSVAFYTFGMAVMFALFVVASVSTRAFLERADFTFDRILLSGASPFAYLLSKALTSALLVFLQLAFLFGAATLILGALRDQPREFWLAAAAVAAGLALAVGALSALVTAVNFRANSRVLSNVFSSVGVMLLAVLGGSFYPVQDTTSLMARVGAWTPNGAALNGFMDAARGLGASTYGGDILTLLVGAGLFLVAALMLFPRRAVS